MQVTVNVANGDIILNTASVTVLSGASGSSTISFEGTIADINTALSSFTYSPTADSFGIGEVQITVDDRGNTGAGGSKTTTESLFIEVDPVNDAPLVASIEGTALDYTENDGAVNVTSTITFSDVDDTSIESAVVQITGNYHSGEDVLSFSDQNGITGSYNSTSGTWTLTGSATLAEYQTAIRSITYTNTSENPDTTTRTVSFAVNDGDADSNTQTRDITIGSVNDDPTNAGSLPTDVTVTEDVSTNIDLSAVDFSDIDAAGGTLTVTLSTSTGGQLSASSFAGVTVAGTSTARTFTGSLTNLNSYFDTSSHIQYLHGTTNTFGDNADTISVVINDNGNTGSGGGTDQNIGSVNVDITAVNDAPSGSDKTVTLDEDSVYVISSADFGFSDFDGDNLDSVHITAAPISGTLFLDFNSDGVVDGGEAVSAGTNVTVTAIDLGRLKFRAATNGFGTAYDSLHFRVIDDGGTANGGVNQDPTANMITFDVNAVNDAPVISLPNGSLTYTPSDPPTIIDAGAIAIDVDLNDFDGGTLTVEFFANATANDRLSINHEGVLAGQIGISGSDVTYGGTLIGSFTGGTDGSTPLVITFNANANVDAVQAVMRNVTYENVSAAPTSDSRGVSFVLTDGDGGTSRSSSKSVNLDVDPTTIVSLSAVQDTFIQASNPSFNDGSAGSIIVDREDSDLQRALLQFDLSSIASGSYIASAHLKLTSTAIDGSLTIEAYQLMESWTETSATWNESSTGTAWSAAGGEFNNASLDSLTIDAIGEHQWNVTTLVQDWVDGTSDNFGLLLASMDGGGNRTVTYDSREGAVAPILEITYSDQVNTANEGIAVWAENGLSTSEYSTFNGTTFTGQSITANVGELAIMQGAEAPTRDEAIVIGIEGGSKTVRGQMWDGSSWSSLSINDLGTAKNDGYWSVDVAYESVSGEAVIVWDNNGVLTYAQWDGSAWTSPTAISAYGGTEVQQLSLAASPDSDEMTLIVSDKNEHDWALVWDGSNWGNQVALTSVSSQDATDVSVTYEQTSGDAMVVYAKDQSDVHYRVWDGAAWSAEGSLAAPAGISGKARWTTVASDPNSDRIAVGVLTESKDVYFAVWDGTSWNASDKVIATTDANDRTYPNLSVAFESESGTALATFNAGDTFIRYRTWSAGSGWSNESSGPDLGEKLTSMTLDSDPESDRIMFTALDENKDVNYVLWNGISFESPQEQEIDAGYNDRQPFVYLWNQSINRAPVLNDAVVVLDSMVEDSGAASGGVGTLVSSLLDLTTTAGGLDNVTDLDTDAVTGLALTDVDTTNGTWYYTVDGGLNWQTVGAVSETSARLLSADIQTRVYFEADANYFGTIANALTFRAWDQTDELANGTGGVDTTDNGGGTAYSIATDVASLSVTAVNDAPVQSAIEAAALGYTENDGPVAITDTIAISDVDDTNIESAVVQISANYLSGEDLLNFTDQNGITGSWNSVTGELTLIGSATLAQYETALRSITYENSSDNPSALPRTIRFTVNDGDANSNTLTRDITIGSVNDDPTNAGSLPIDMTVTEDVLSNVDLSAVDFSDVDAASSSLTITLTTSIGGELSASTSGGVTVGGTATARTFTGSLADLNTYFDTASNIQYQHGTLHTFGNDADTINVVINDNGNTGTGGGTDQDLGTVNVDITAVNDEEVLAINTGVTVAEGSTGNTITTAMLHTTDVDNLDTELVYTVDTDVSNGTLRLSGTALAAGDTFTQADIDAGNVTYDHDGSQTSADSFDFTVDDGAGTDTSATFNFTVTNVNDAPINTVPAAQTVDEDNSVAITGISVTDTDDNLSTVQLTVGNGTVNVTLSGAASISAGANDSNELTLSGSLADINATLASLTYQGNTNFNGSDTLTILSTDSDSATDSDTVAITVNAVNDTPHAVGPGSAYSVNEQTNLNIHGTGFGVTDVDAASGTMTATIQAGEGTLALAAGDSGVSISTNNAGTVTFTGTLAQIDALLTGSSTGTIVYNNGSDTPSASTTITVTVNDGGNTGADPGTTADGSSEEDSASQTINITATNDDPTNAGSLPSDITVTEDVASNVDLSAIDFSDVDAASSSLTVTLSTSTDGELTLAADASLTFGGSATARTITGSLADLNAYFDNVSNISYLHGTPHTFGNDADTINVVINDNGNTGTGGGTDQDLGTVNVDITAVNDEEVLPTNTGDTVAEGSTGNVVTTAMLSTTDVDNLDSELVYTIDAVVSNGTLRLSGTALAAGDTFTQADIDAGLVTYDHDGSQTSSDSFDFTVDDGAGTTTSNTFNWTITNVNDAPVAVADAATAVEAGGVATATAGTNPSGNVLTNDTDVDAVDTQEVVGVVAGSAASAVGSVGTGVTGTYGSITIDASGNYTYTVDNDNATVQSLRTSSDTMDDVFTYTMQDAAGLTSTTQVTITIVGANDAPDDLTTAGLTVAENAANGTSVGIMTSSDIDSGDTMSYSVVDDAGGRFAVNATTGEVTVANGTLLDRESNASHPITVRVTDAAGLSYDEAFTVAITDVDEFDVSNPIDTNPASNEVDENVAIGTVVNITASGSDDDATTNIVTYSLFDDDGGNFAIDASTGVVTTAALIDRESLGASRNITVRAMSSDGSTADTVFTININDLDEFDTTAISDTNATDNSVAENAANGTVVGLTAFASDADATTNAITYTLDDNAGGRFAIDASTGVVTVADGSLLDYETAASYNITVRATSTDASFSTQIITITIGDVDEFDVTVPTDIDANNNEVNENVVVGTIVGITADAFDLDATTNTISYSLTDNVDGIFQIDANTGVVTTAAAINREVHGATRSITVQAASSDGSTATQTFNIAINDLDEFDVTSAVDTNLAANEVDENVAIGTVVNITASSSDDDATTNIVTYSLFDDDGGNFAIDASTGVVTTAALIDRETLGASRNITVRATSIDGSTADTVFTISINDLDEFNTTAVTDTNATANSVVENAANGRVVGITASASDADATTNTMTYTLDDNAGGRFAVDASTGVVTVADGSPLDFETTSSHGITVRATSADSSFTTQSFTINVTDVNEATVGAISDTDVTTNIVLENTTIGTTVGVTVLATDPDGTDTVSYILDNNAGGRFAVDANTGIVTVAGAIDREAAASYDITVRATSTDTSFTTQAFTIAIGDENEFGVTVPTDTNPAENEVFENSPVGTTVGITALAIDQDATNNIVTYSLDDDAGGRFVVNPVSGEVTLSGTVDYETTDRHTIAIRATSSDGSSSLQQFSIRVLDVNEAPGFDAAGLITIDEHASVGSTVYVVSASDPDHLDVLTYSLVSGSPSLPFAIDSASGTITVTDSAALDFETTPNFTLVVQVRDNQGLTDQLTLNLALNDINEAPVSLQLAGGAIAENSAVGRFVGQLTGTDVDAGDTLRYELTDNAGGRFSIDPITGLLTVANGQLLDFEQQPQHSVTVRVTDVGGLSLTRSFQISLTDINEAPVAGNNTFQGDQLRAIRVEAGVLLANASDPDGDTLTVVLVSGPSSGSLTLNADGSFTYLPTELFSGQDTFRYLVSDGSLLSNVATVTINISTTVTGTSAPDTATPSPTGSDNSNPETTVDVPPPASSGDDAEVSESGGAGQTTQASGAGPVTVRSDAQDSIPISGGNTQDERDTLVSTSSDFYVSVFLQNVAETSDLRNSLLSERRSTEGTLTSEIFSGPTFLFDQITTTTPVFANGSMKFEEQVFLQKKPASANGIPLLEKVVVGTSAAVSTSVSVGYAVWMLRGGSLLTAFLSSLPAWQSFDPLPLLNSDPDGGDEDEESLASIATGN